MKSAFTFSVLAFCIGSFAVKSREIERDGIILQNVLAEENLT